MIDANERWLLSYYRHSELGGAEFFGRLARVLRPGTLKEDMTRHYADESRHAELWTACLDGLGATPVLVENAYQDRYLEVAGCPANVMEVLAVTHVFERRAMRAYVEHARRPGVHPLVRETVDQLIDDERRHVKWVTGALREMETDYGRDEVRGALARYEAADLEIYQGTLEEYEERLTRT